MAVIGNWGSGPHFPLPFKEVIADVLKVKPPEKGKPQKSNPEKP